VTFEDELRDLIRNHLAANSGNVGAFLRITAALEDAKDQLDVDLHVTFTDEQWDAYEDEEANFWNHDHRHRRDRRLQGQN
jgi:hypothetical protein